jgi:hypothetical protein
VVKKEVAAAPLMEKIDAAACRREMMIAAAC